MATRGRENLLVCALHCLVFEDGKGSVEEAPNFLQQNESCWHTLYPELPILVLPLMVHRSLLQTQTLYLWTLLLPNTSSHHSPATNDQEELEVQRGRQ